jgi:hypothetical protein
LFVKQDYSTSGRAFLRRKAMKSCGALPAGTARPVFVAGVRYKSIFEAWIETGISNVWIWKMLKASDGFPVVIRRQMVAPEHRVKRRVNNLEDTRI